MPKQITLGTAQSQPGTIQYGQYELITHPTGHTDFLPVIIAQGIADGPCFWLTGGIHGNEHTGPLVIYKLITAELVAQLKGTIIAIPGLNPAGLRTEKRVPYHDFTDPNRLWPDGRSPKKEPDPEKRPPSALEQVYARLFEEIVATADYLIDYHNSYIHSIPFVFRDRVLYRTHQNKAQNRVEAEALSARLEEMLTAFGHTNITEYPVEKYIDEDLHRSTSGAILLLKRIPAFTVELGSGLMPDLAIVDAAVVGTRNVLRWAGMLTSDKESITGIKVVDPGFQVRRSRALRVDQPCVVIHQVKSGDLVQAGNIIAEMRDMWGRSLGVIQSEHDGLILSPSYGIYYYPGQTVVYMAVRDENPLVGPYPKDYFKA
jgi:uncharacterized protein